MLGLCAKAAWQVHGTHGMPIALGLALPAEDPVPIEHVWNIDSHECAIDLAAAGHALLAYYGFVLTGAALALFLRAQGLI